MVLSQTPSPTTTKLPVESCLDNGFPKIIDKDTKLSGEILYQATDNKSIRSINLEKYAASLETYTALSIVQVDTDTVHGFGVSPNGKWMGYAIISEAERSSQPKFVMVLLSKSGEKIEQQIDLEPFKDQFRDDIFVGLGNSYWINDELISTSLLVQNPSDYGSKIPRSIPAILEPFSASWKVQLLSSQSEWNGETEVGFSSNLDFVVIQEHQTIRLKDLRTKTHLWNSNEFYLSIPETKIRWAPNGGLVAIGNRFIDPKIILVSVTGKQEGILQFESGFVDFEWSPNSRFLAVFHSIGDNNKAFYLYDILAEQIVKQCAVQEQPWDVLFTWSPDSQMVAFGAYDGNLQIWDINSGVVYKAAMLDVLPLNWQSDSFVP